MEDLKIIQWFKSTDERYKRLTELQKKDVLTPEEEWIYDADLKYCRDKINQLRYAAEMAFEIGKVIGRIESTGITLSNADKLKIIKAYDASPDMIQAITGKSEYEISMEEIKPLDITCASTPSADFA